MIINETKLTMLNPAGRVVSVPFHLKTELLKQGFKIISNAKEEYYPTWDKGNKSWQKDVVNVVEDIDVNNFLEVDKL